jgi:hypothetical protein
MKRSMAFFSVLAALLLMSALPAIAGGTGPYGFFGPSLDIATGSETQHVALAGGTGPYGSFGPSDGYNIVPGSEMQHVAAFTGSGPYGAYGPSGMTSWGESSQIANKDECLLVAKNCPDDFTVQKRIDRLNTEISKGTSVYTPDEINMLKKERDEAYRELGAM